MSAIRLDMLAFEKNIHDRIDFIARIHHAASADQDLSLMSSRGARRLFFSPGDRGAFHSGFFPKRNVAGELTGSWPLDPPKR